MARRELEIFRGGDMEPADADVPGFLGKLTLLGQNRHGSDIRAGALVPRQMAKDGPALMGSRWKWEYYSPGMVGALLVTRVSERTAAPEIDVVSSLHMPARCDEHCVLISPYHSLEESVPDLGGRPILSLFTEEDRSTRTLPNLAVGAVVMDVGEDVLRAAYGNLLEAHHSLLPLRGEFVLPPVHPEITAE